MNKIYVVLAAVLLTATTAEAKQPCLTKADPTTWSAWRLLDGRQCWYQGKPGKDRTSLYWAAPQRTVEGHRPKIAIPLPPEAPNRIDGDATKNTLALVDRLNYTFGVLAAQGGLQPPSGLLPLALANPWLGYPWPPGLQGTGKPPEGWQLGPPPKPAPTSWWESLWQKTLRAWHWLQRMTTRSN